MTARDTTESPKNKLDFIRTLYNSPQPEPAIYNTGIPPGTARIPILYREQARCS